jgi:hypothetical protein
MSSLTLTGNALTLRTPYSAALVADLKAQVPAPGRAWDGTAKAWQVAPQYADICAALVKAHFGETVSVPQAPGKVATETRLLDVRYIGTTKERGQGETSAFGWCDGGWRAIFAEGVLRGWFCQDATPTEGSTLYAVLSVKPTATPDELKSAYRRLARTWHPDTCHEQDAAATFRTIQHAWEVLNIAKTRRRYDAGLALAATLTPAAWHADLAAYGYRSPLRCGLIMAEGQAQLGRFVVAQILGWEDITRADGRTLSTSWPLGATTFEENWT